MTRPKIIIIILCLFIAKSVDAATFVVTSNADSGTGTLREALTEAAANGTTEIDYINFNLPGNTQADITITVKTQLPDVTANVIIDGTTQPGAFLGVSNAKVIITVAAPTQHLDAFNVSSYVTQNDAVEFYGLYIEGFSPDSRGYGNGIVTNADCKLVIGAPGRGNVICGNWVDISGYFVNAKIQSNFIGLEPDGETIFPGWTTLYSSEDYDNLLIGGSGPLDGNVIINGYDDGIEFGGLSFATINKTVTISNNYFGTNYTATKSLRTYYYSDITANDYNTTLLIYNNVFTAGILAINTYNQVNVTVKGNFFGTNKTQTVALGNGGSAISENGGTAIIGGDNAADQNVFTNYDDPFSNIGSPVDVIKNTFYCNNTVETYNGGAYLRFIKLLDNEVSGDAPAGALVQLYFTTSTCPTCNPVTWFASVTANASGVWDYKGNTTQNIMGSATIGNNTAGFQPYTISANEVLITNVDCHHPGSLALKEKRIGRFQFIWTDSNGTIVSTGQEAGNLGPGEYFLQINEGGACPIAKGQFEVTDLRSTIVPQTYQLSCDHATASFTANVNTVSPIKVVKYYWTDEQGNSISTTNTVSGLNAGNYYLYITDSNGCNSNTALFQVFPQVNAPVIDVSKVIVTDAHCDNADGAIKGLTFTNSGIINYGWASANGSQFFYNQTNLTGVMPGQYYFFIEYTYGCPPIKTAVYTVGSQNAVSIDASKATVANATCSDSNGSVKGVSVTGATKYQWFDGQSNVVFTSIDLVGMPGGSYYLVASNASCSAQTQVFTIDNLPANKNFPLTDVVNSASCGLSNGSIVVTFTGTAPQSSRWATQSGNPLGSGPSLNNAPAGTYDLYVTDNNGCESFYGSYTVSAIPHLQINPGYVASNDQCGLGKGTITGITVAGGLPPYKYVWSVGSGQVVTNSIDLTNVVAGQYTLTVTDATGCNTVNAAFTIGNDSETVSPPNVSNLQLCSSGNAILAVNNPQQGYGYRLYSTPTGATMKDDEANGVFKINVTSSGSLFVSAYTGQCESARVEVKVLVGLSSVNIPNTFTPNDDGVNDLWEISGLINYPNALVQIFTRNGQKVFESRGYNSPFDGKMNGAKLPVGVYYYIINLNSDCALLSGSLTLIR